MEYKFKEGEESKPPIERIIEKTGDVVEFSLLEIENNAYQFEKTLKELKANRELKQGILNNLDIHHPFIKDMSEFDRYAVHMYQEAWALVKAYNEKITEIEKQYKSLKDETATIKEALPELADVVSPYVQLVKPEEKPVDKPVEETQAVCVCDSETKVWCPVHDEATGEYQDGTEKID